MPANQTGKRLLLLQSTTPQEIVILQPILMLLDAMHCQEKAAKHRSPKTRFGGVLQVVDAGRTEIAAGSMTVLAIGGPSDSVNEVTGHLSTF